MSLYLVEWLVCWLFLSSLLTNFALIKQVKMFSKIFNLILNSIEFVSTSETMLITQKNVYFCFLLFFPWSDLFIHFVGLVKLKANSISINCNVFSYFLCFAWRTIYLFLLLGLNIHSIDSLRWWMVNTITTDHTFISLLLPVSC